MHHWGEECCPHVDVDAGGSLPPGSVRGEYTYPQTAIPHKIPALKNAGSGFLSEFSLKRLAY